jgi:hypothetical protein
MANVTELGTFAAQQFYRQGMGRSLTGEISYLNNISLLQSIFSQNDPARDYLNDDRVLTSVAELIETMSWYQLGTQIGYFSDSEIETPKIPRLISEVVRAHGPDAWAPPFRQIASRFVESALRPFEESISFEDSSALAIFQAAIIAAEQFREPLVVNLTKYLNSSDSSPLQSADPQQVFMALEYYTGPMRDDFTSDALVAGLLRLIDGMDSIISIFPAEIRKNEDNSARRILGTRVVQLLSWRVDLWDERKAFKLTELINLFWQVCEIEAEKHSSTIRLELGDAVQNLRSLLEAWDLWAETDQRSIVTQSQKNQRFASAKEENPPAASAGSTS